MRSVVCVGLVIASAAWPVVALAEIATLDETQLTIDVPEGWRYAGRSDSSHHPGVRVDLLTTTGAELRVFLSSDGCVRPVGGRWAQGAAQLLPDEFDQVWRTTLRDTEQGCFASRRGELVVVMTTADTASWDSARSHQLANRLLEAAAGPIVSAEIDRARLRAHTPGSGLPLALSVGLQLTTVADAELYREASSFVEVSGRLGVFSRPIVIRLEVEAGRASTGALRLDTQLVVGGMVKRGAITASLAVGGAIGGQTASEADTPSTDEDPIPAALRLPIIVEAATLLARRVHVSSRLRIAWQPGDDRDRVGGSRSLGVDEFGCEARLHIGRTRRAGFFAGLGYDEELGTGLLSLTLGIAAVPP